MNSLSFLKGAHVPSVRTSLALAVVGCVLPVAVVSAFSIVSFYEREQTRLTVNTISRAHAIISLIDRDIATTQAALWALGTSPSLAKGDFGSFDAQAVEALRDLQADSIVVVDPAGQFLLSTRRPFGESLPKITNPALERLRRVLATGSPAVSDLFPGPLVNRLLYTIAVPGNPNVSKRYSLNATVPAAHLSGVLTEQKLPESWRASIIDSSGSVVARTHDIEKFIGKRVNEDLLQRMSVSNEGSFETRTLDGIPVITFYSRSSVTKWAVTLGMPIVEFTAPLRQTLAWLVVATLSALAIGLALARFIGGRIAGSISALIKPATILGSGAMPSIPRLLFREANELREALISAATTLRQATHDAHHDALTGLANRTLFHIVVDQQLTICKRNGIDLAILYIDLDGFKAVNDIHGHALGDQVLVAASIRIKSAIRDSDIAARLGGDEFAVALVQTDLATAKNFAGKLIETISRPYQVGEIETKISASIGVAGYPISATDADTLLASADRAMYKAKELGKRRVYAATQ